MTLSNILTVAGLVISIVFGFYITHWYSVRDTRIRVVKNHYIGQIQSIKGRVDQFFHQVAWAKSSAKKIVKWYTHISMDISSIDNGVRKTLDLHIEPIGKIVFSHNSEITRWDDFNDQYTNSKYIPSSEHIERLLFMMSEADDFLNNQIHHINQANSYSFFTVQWRKIKDNQQYYVSINKSYPWVHAVFERVEKHFWEIILCIGMLVGFIYLCCTAKDDKKQDLEKPLKEICSKQDSLVKVIREFKIKYEPVQIETKAFKNSSFFNANNIDSVQVKLYNGTPIP